MSHYVAIIEDAGPDRAVGIWFPDLPGCFSAGDTIDEALHSAPEAVALYAEALGNSRMPTPRPLNQLQKDSSFRSEAEGHLVALISVPELAEPAE